MSSRSRTVLLSVLGAGAIVAGVIGWSVLGAADPATAMPARDPQCRLDDLTAQLTEPNATLGSPTELRVIWVNRSDHACTMTGFGGVDLVDARGEHLSVLRADEPPAPTTVELTPGMRAHSTFRYTAQGGTGVFVPVAVLATPPDETRSARLPWTAGGVPTFPSPSTEELSLSPVQPNVS